MRRFRSVARGHRGECGGIRYSVFGSVHAEGILGTGRRGGAPLRGDAGMTYPMMVRAAVCFREPDSREYCSAGTAG